MTTVKEYKVFIASPDDVISERDIIEKEINKISIPKVRLKVIRWENDLPSTSGTKPQDLINNFLLDECDLLVGLFWTKFGKKTKNADSGTVEEIEKFILNRKPVILYFFDKPVNPLSINSEDIEKIKQFREKYKDNGIYKVLNSNEYLIDNIRKDIIYNIEELEKGVMTITNNKEVISNNTSKNIVVKNKITKLDNLDFWRKERISSLINEYLDSKQLSYEYMEQLTFEENLLRAKATDKTFMSSTIEDIMNQARVYAFNRKYGQYNYEKDMRKGHKEWYKPILTIIENHFNKTDGLDIIGVGSNYGKELIDIFNDKNNTLTVLELSNEAINRGRKLYKKIKFLQGNMEREYPTSQKYDVCLCLRAIQSRGVFRVNAIIQMESILKKGGLIMISIPHGYLVDNDEEIIGLYDHRVDACVYDKPYEIANKIYRKLHDYGFKNIKIYTLNTEVLVWGVKK